MAKVAAVFHDEYWGQVSICVREVVDLAPLAIWAEMTGIDDREPQSLEDGYIEDWDAYGSHHKGMITRIWWGEGCIEKAETCYNELVASGVKPEAEEG